MKQFRKRMLLTGLAVTVVLGTTAPTVKVFANQQAISTTVVTDVADNHWAKKQIDAFIKEGILQGYPDKTFRPSNKITRAEFVRIVNRAFGFNTKGDQSFKDVKKDAWYTEDIQIAVKKGYINGFEDNTFRPNEEITREQMAKILGMVLNVSGDGKTDFLDDSKIAPWAKKYVDGLAEKGIIEGYTDKTFKPKDNATRAESVRLTAESRDYKNSNSDNGYYPVHPTPNPEQKPVTSEDLKNEFKGKDEVKLEDVKLEDGATVPAGKTLVLSGNSSIVGTAKLEGTLKVTEGSKVTLDKDATMNVSGTVDLSQGTMNLEGKLSLENGGTLNTKSTSNASLFTKDIRKDEPKIVGNGAVLVGNGTVKVKNLGEVDAEIIGVNKTSKVLIGDNIFLDNSKGKNSTITLNEGTLSFKFGAKTEIGNTHYMTVNGDVTYNTGSQAVIVKASGRDSKLKIDVNKGNANWTKVALYNKDGLYDLGGDGEYVGNTNGTWSSTIPETPIEPSNPVTTSSTITVSSITTNSTVTTDETIKLDVTTSGTTTGDTTKVLFDGREANNHSFELNDKFTNAVLTIETAKDKKIKQLVINGKEIELPNTLQNGTIITVTLTKEDLIELGLDLNKEEQTLDITVVESK